MPPLQKPVRWGILGTGAAARDFASGLRSLRDVVLAAVGSRTPARAEAFGRELAVPRAHASYEELVADPDVDVVYIATPAAVHSEHCLLALSAGKAVLCEKPFTTNAAEARTVVAMARSARLFCMEAMWMRFLPIMARLRTLLDERAVGDVRLLSADLGHPTPVGSSSRHLDPALSVGSFLDLGVYPLSLAFFVLGRPDRIVAQATMGPTGVDEDSAAVLHYAGGGLAVLTASLRSQLPGEGLVVGTRGHIRIHSPLYRPHRLTVHTHPDLPRAQPAAGPTGSGLVSRARANRFLRSVYFRYEGLLQAFLVHSRSAIVEPFNGNGYNYEAAEVVRCLRAGEIESPVMPLDETVAIMEALDEIRAAWARTE